jgi:hypothetical protein
VNRTYFQNRSCILQPKAKVVETPQIDDGLVNAVSELILRLVERSAIDQVYLK